MSNTYCRGACKSFFIDSNGTELSPFEKEVYDALPQKVKNCLIVKPRFIVGEIELPHGLRGCCQNNVSFVYSCPGRLYVLDARETPLPDLFVGDDIEYHHIRSLSDIPELPLIGAGKEMGAVGLEKIFWGDGDLIAVFDVLRRRSLYWNRIKDYELIEITTQHLMRDDSNFCLVSVDAKKEAFRVPVVRDIKIQILVCKSSGFVSIVGPHEQPYNGKIVYDL